MPVVKLTVIVARVRRAVAPPDGIGVSINDPLGDHFKPLDTKTLAGMLNRREGFKQDGLKLRTTDTKKAKIVRDLVDAVRNWYETENGWTVS